MKDQKEFIKSFSEIKKAGGVGSKGGIIIGHDKKGNPIYQSEAEQRAKNKKTATGKKDTKGIISKLKDKIKNVKEAKETKEQHKAGKEAKKVKAEKSLNKETDMNKSELIEKYATLVKSGKMTMEDVVKSLKAGYETSLEKTPQQLEAEAKEVEAQVEAKAAGKEIKFADGLFNDFTVGSTLEQTPSGNMISNVKPSKEDYVKQFEASKKMTTETPGEKK